MARRLPAFARGRLCDGVTLSQNQHHSIGSGPLCLRRNIDTTSKAKRCLYIVHLTQIWGKVAAMQGQRGLRPMEYLGQCGFLSPRLVAAHCRCMIPDEERLLGASGTAVAFNSAIAARRALSPRIADLEAYGCTIALGTDIWPRTWSKSCVLLSSWNVCADKTAVSPRLNRCLPGPHTMARVPSALTMVAGWRRGIGQT